MNREVETGLLVIDQFPAYEDDGYTKRSGLTTPTDLVVTVYKNGAPDATVVTIAEIGTTGDYKLTFTPLTDGLYAIQVLIDFSKEVWGGYYNASVADLTAIKNQVDKIDQAATLGTAAATTGSLLDRLCNKDTGKSFNQATDSLEAIRDRTG
jgi:hypothetical protein